eukprot:4121733-Amphidinium_carterae.1
MEEAHKEYRKGLDEKKAEQEQWYETRKREFLSLTPAQKSRTTSPMRKKTPQKALKPYDQFGLFRTIWSWVGLLFYLHGSEQHLYLLSTIPRVKIPRPPFTHSMAKKSQIQKEVAEKRKEQHPTTVQTKIIA